MSTKQILAAVAASAAVTAFAAEPAYDTLIAHRGESVDAPENTLPACKMAVERGFGFEFHVWCIDDLPNAREAFRRGVQTVTTNCAKKLLDGHKATEAGNPRGGVR